MDTDKLIQALEAILKGDDVERELRGFVDSLKGAGEDDGASPDEQLRAKTMRALVKLGAATSDPGQRAIGRWASRELARATSTSRVSAEATEMARQMGVEAAAYRPPYKDRGGRFVVPLVRPSIMRAHLDRKGG